MVFGILLNKQRTDRYQKARRITEKLVRLFVEKYEVKKIVLLGSILHEQRFHEHSDIDLCVACLSNENYFQALSELIMESDEFDIDLTLIEDTSERMKEYINKEDILYEG